MTFLPLEALNAHYSDKHDCPLLVLTMQTSIAGSLISLWIGLHRCQEPLLVQLSVTQPLDDPESTILLRTCTSSSGTSHAFAAKQINNPKKWKELYQIRLETASACVITGTKVQDKLKLAIGGSNERNSIHATRLLDGMEMFFSARDNCDENFLFAYYNGTAAGLYIGPGLGKPTAKSALSALSNHLRTRGAVMTATLQQSRRQPPNGAKGTA
ncbi:hypothetical protein MGYG_08115 [Nannizzia gypsea CBS 118893]|uniref:Uncharacterized protein n=1 Tax=Arthroderma gypseum (strain ATCC MYA-4604 / CBS 118893) TaxID=535722 RepID=E4V532_ARTGP|nr:hypothetical protein MGYG_08115 [Nannizzia gypsea CBS 118893]EFR05106.1 hypothetical protein MGYG_08115 [Nannizzia gypsea CBS 118893]